LVVKNGSKARRELAAFRHRVAGVDREIEERAFEAMLIDVDAPQPTRSYELHGDVFGNGAPENVGDAAEQLVGVGPLWRERLLA
jgi:predicted subunit of tRNA(5-methylaminomethyl-2-thiouridylate) methyltransferase